jgi:predicted RNase H-like HicB family nuclease
MIEYPIVLEQESDGRFSVFAPDLPGCASWGDTREEAITHITEAIELWIESAKANDEHVPAPGSSVEYVKIAS